MFWNNCPDLLCYMLAFYPNVHLISIRMFTWTEVRLVVISYTATPLKATAAQHLNTTQRDAEQSFEAGTMKSPQPADEFHSSFRVSQLLQKQGGEENSSLKRRWSLGTGTGGSPPQAAQLSWQPLLAEPALLPSPQTQHHPLTWGTLFHTTTFFPSCSLLSAILFLTCQNPGPRSHDRSCNSCYKSCKGVILLMSHIATQPPLDMRMLRPTKPFPFQDPWREGPRSTRTPAMGLLMAGTRERGS